MRPSNEKLYKEVVAEAKKRYKRFPSAYASMWITKTYKERGGKYEGKKKANGTSRWLREEWSQVTPFVKYGLKVPCGQGEQMKACRPTVRVTKDTPFTMQEALRLHGKAGMLRLAKQKKANLDKRIYWSKP